MGHWGEKRPPPFSHPWQERGTHTTGDSLALAFVGRDHKPAHLATGCIFPWTDDVDVCSQGLRRLAATRRRTLSTSLLLLCPSRRRGTQRFCRHCRPASSFLSSFLSPPPFLLFFPSRGRPSDGRAITLGSRIFSAEQSLSRFSPHGEGVWTGKSTVCGGLSRTPHPGSSLSNQSRKTVGKCRTSLPNYARSRVSLAEHSLQEWAGNVVERGFSFFLFAKVSQRAPPVFCGEKRDNYRCFPAPSSLYCPASFGTVSACTRRPATFLFPSFLLSLLGIKP